MPQTFTATEGTVPKAVRMEPEHIEKIRQMARSERRTFGAQVSYLIALGLEVAERKEQNAT